MKINQDAGQRAIDRHSAGSPSMPVIGIGASAGGLEAIRDMLSVAQLPTGMTFVVVQHLDPNHESLLAELLGRQTALTVRQAVEGERVEADHVYIIPPGHGLDIKDRTLRLTPFAQPRGLRRPIDDFFLSLAEDQKELAACVILSGTGADGTLGLRAIKENGGLALVQDPETARYDGMPLSAAGTGMVDFVLNPREVLPRLRDYFGRAMGAPIAETGDQVEEICRVLREQTEHDFSGYKQTTLVRRIQRRMQVLGMDDAARYRARVRADATEAEALLRDLLINVTRFFRDPEHFEILRQTVIAPMVAEAAADDEIRVWVPGCSSGEEAYSIAFLFAEEMRTQHRRPMVQIFATDIDEQMLQIAREGRYLGSALVDIPAHLRDQHTIQHGDHFRIASYLRDMIRFSSHSVIKDPPFSRLSLVSCRNLFIYFGDRLQSGVLPIFHYALNPGGVLFLGPSETIGRSDDLFSAIDQKARIFRRSDAHGRYPIEMPAARTRSLRADGRGQRWGDQGGMDMDPTLALQRLADRYSRPSVVLNQEGTLLSTHGRLGRYFEFSAGGGGSALHNARPGLREVLMPLLREAVDTRRRVVTRDIEVRAEFGRQKLDVIADPLADGTVLIVFRDTGAFEAEPDDDLLEIGPSDGQVDILEGELRHMRRQLRDKTEELETANEELKSSNEEMMSMNEELQSTNEELSTVNDELKDKVDQLSVANDDLKNFFASTQLALVVLDGDMRLRSFTDATLDLFPLQQSDRGRPLSQLASFLEPGYLAAAREVIAGEDEIRLRIAHADGSRKWMLNIRPYRLLDGTRDGAILIFTDITEVMALQDELDRERERLELAVRLARIGVWEYEPERDQFTIDQTEARLLGITAPGEHPVDEMLSRISDEDREHVRTALERSGRGGVDFQSEFRLKAQEGEQPRHLKALGRLVSGSTPPRIIGVTFDVTADRRAADTRELMIREMNHRVKNLFAVISALVSTTARSATDKDGLADSLRGKIAALGRAHALTNDLDGVHGVPLERLVGAILEPYAGEALLSVSGPYVETQPDEVTPLALILHEWATNAAKYGALRGDSGRLDISWDHEADGSAVLTWLETHEDILPETAAEIGFGSRLVQISAQQIGAELDNRTDGNMFQWRMTLKPRPAK